MDPVSLVIAALVAGAAKGVGESAATAVQDSYHALRAKVRQMLGNEPSTDVVLAGHETDPDTYEAPLRKKLETAGVDSLGAQDALIVAAQQVLAAADPEGTHGGKYMLGAVGSMSSDRGGVTIGKNTGPVNVDNTFHVAAPLVVSWPIRVGSIPPLAAAFQPRPATRARIEAAWTAASSSTPAPVILTQTVIGDGGVGKSQLAAAIAGGATGAGTDLVVWVPASSRDQVLAVYAEAGRRVQAPGSDNADTDLAALAFLNWATTTSRSWLVVLDDATLTDASLDGLWPTSTTGTGRVLVTTRDRSAAGPRPRIDLGVFTPDEAESYQRERVADFTDPTAPGVLDDSAALAEDLGYLPVALAQAIAVVLNDGITTREYRARFADRSRKLTELFPDHAKADGYARTVATTWSLALEQASKISPYVRPVAELLALLDPAGAPDTLIMTAAACTYLARYPARALADETGQVTASDPGNGDVSPEQAWSGLRALHRLSVVNHDLGGGPQAIRTHALAQRAITDTANPERVTVAVRAVADALIEIWPDPERDTTLGAVLRANTSHIQSIHPEALWSPGTAGGYFVLSKALTSLGNTGQVTAAVQTANDLHAEAQRRLGPDHPDTLATRNNLAFWRGEAGDPAGAAAATEELLADRIRILGPDHPDTLTTRNNLAFWRGDAGNPAGAVTALEELLIDSVRVLGPDHPDTLTTRNNLAYWRGDAGDPAGAAAAFKDLLTDQERILGPDHPNTLSTRNNLAYWKGEAGDPAGAAAALEDLLTDQERILGPDHPKTLSTRNNLAYCRGEAGDPAGADAALEELLTAMVRILGPDHPNTLATRNNLAFWRGQTGDPAGAAT